MNVLTDLEVTEITLERFQNLRRVMQDVVDDPAKKFDHGLFGIQDPACGTSACIVGWATSDPWFQENGLTAQWLHPGPHGVRQMIVDVTPDPWVPVFSDGSPAICAFAGYLDITALESGELVFGSCDTPEEALALIETFITVKEQKLAELRKGSPSEL